MSKRVIITKEIQDAVRLSIGDPELDLSKFAVYEARMLSTEPLRKGGFFQKARVSASTLKEMEARLNRDGGAIPLQIMHNNQILPVGKAVTAKVKDMGNGEVELRGLFIVPLDKKDIVSDLDNSVVDEVSVGMLNKHALCSECDFDYFGEDASFSNLMELTCDEGHTIGVDGTYIRLVGLEDWAELSLVGSGAAKDAKILPRAKQNLSKDTLERLAASGTPIEARLTVASYKMEKSEPSPTKEGEVQMELDKFVAELKATTSELAATKVGLDQANEKLTALNAEITTLKASIESKDKTIQELEAAKGQPVKELETKLKSTEDELKAAADKLLPHLKAALVASGAAEADLPKDLTLQAMLGMIEEKGLKLHQAVGAGGAASSGEKTVQPLDAKADPRKEAFKLSSR